MRSYDFRNLPFKEAVRSSFALIREEIALMGETDQGLVEEVVDETPPDADTSPEPENDTVSDPIDPEDPKT
jgi:hypothetical protein